MSDLLHTSETRSPDPFPDGWFTIAPSADIVVGKLIEKTWMGEQIVVWRDDSGAVCVADAFCPHLGSHLGPSTGGKVRNGRLVCPFHGFEYDVTGRCVATPSAPPPRSARLKRYEVSEVNGFVFAYRDRAGRAPHWQIPDLASPDAVRAVRRVRFKGHPQTTSENAVDRGHLGHVHGYRKLQQTRATEIDGPLLSSAYSFTRQMLSPGFGSFELALEIDIAVWGLGVSTVAVRGLNGLDARNWILSTPVDGEFVDMWLAVDVMRLPRWALVGGALGRLVRRLTAHVVVHDLMLEVRKDAEIWGRQRYQEHPVFCAADRDILRFRRYSEQFYSESAATTQTPAMASPGDR